MTCRRATNPPRRPAQRNTRLVHSKTSHKAQHLALTLSKELILALTLTKLVLRIKDLNSMLLDGLEVFLGVCVISWDSSKLQMAGGTHIYGPPT